MILLNWHYVDVIEIFNAILTFRDGGNSFRLSQHFLLIYLFINYCSFKDV